MSSPLKVRVLGSGTSNGVPVVGCDCEVCRSENPRNKRSRASILLSQDGSNVLIDTATEFRLQAVAAGISSVDAVLFTHAHADHVHGLDDIRPLTHHRPMDLYGSYETLKEIRERFSYIFHTQKQGGGTPRVTLHTIGGTPSGSRSRAPEPIRIASLEIQPIPILHGKMPILGYRVGGFAYLTDCSEIPEESYPLLRGLEVLIIDSLRYRQHPTHFNVEQALEEIRKIAPKEAYLTHMCHDLEYERLAASLPPGVAPAYDGLELTFSLNEH